jgi:hypothetical protein
MAKKIKPVDKQEKKSRLSKITDAGNSFSEAIKERIELRGRPTIYTEELSERICKAIENSPRGLRWICANNDDFPASETIRDWLSKETYPIFSARYARARAMQADFLSDEIMDVTYDAQPDKFGRVEKEKLMIDAIKWKAKALKPKIYGDNPEKFLEVKNDEVANTTKETLAEKVSRIVGLAKNKLS